ncbi:hypothetical protein NQ345_24525, partial [Escherichia coli]|nr:hypothetical protein [Escherichia coli]
MSDAEAETIGLAVGSAARPRSRAATPRQVLAIVSVGICLANLDLFIVNVGLPNIAQEFRGA